MQAAFIRFLVLVTLGASIMSAQCIAGCAQVKSEEHPCCPEHDRRAPASCVDIGRSIDHARIEFHPYPAAISAIALSMSERREGIGYAVPVFSRLAVSPPLISVLRI